jgi:hypothetical protein
MAPDGQEMRWTAPGKSLEAPVFEHLQINHYFIKSVAQWEQKMRRGYHDIERSGAEFAAYDRNEVADTAILRFVPHTKAIMSLVG